MKTIFTVITTDDIQIDRYNIPRKMFVTDDENEVIKIYAEVMYLNELRRKSATVPTIGATILQNGMSPIDDDYANGKLYKKFDLDLHQKITIAAIELYNSRTA